MKTCLSALALTLSAYATSAQVITFDTADQALPLSTQGFDFVGVGVASGSTDRRVTSGELVMTLADGFADIVLSPTGGGTFDVYSLDYAVEGFDSGGFTEWEIVTDTGQRFELDPLPTSGTLILDVTGIESLTFSGFSPFGDDITLRIDNIAIPEPAGAALLISGGLAVVLRRRGRRDRS